MGREGGIGLDGGGADDSEGVFEGAEEAEEPEEAGEGIVIEPRLECLDFDFRKRGRPVDFGSGLMKSPDTYLPDTFPDTLSSH